MTDMNDNALTGEERLKKRRMRFFRFCIIAYLFAVALGFASGYAEDLFSEGRLPGWTLFALWGFGVMGLSWFTISYFRRVDELDLLDNLWASMVALYFYAVAFPSWYLFHDIGLLEEPDQIIIYMATGAVLVAAYLLRKLGVR